MITTLALAALLAAADAPAPAPSPLPSNCSVASGFSGVVCVPQTAGKHPLLMMFGGWEGGSDAMASLAPAFAKQGYVAASVAYFQAPGLPDQLRQIPVETAGAALGVLQGRADVDPARVAAYGVSRGSELALLAAIRYPAIRAVVAGSPSPFSYGGALQSADVHVPSWTMDGKPVPYVPFTGTILTVAADAYRNHTPIVMRTAYDDAAKDEASVASAVFPLERIRGPVLFLAGDADAFWSAASQAKRGYAYLQAKHHDAADAIEIYPNAGHFFEFATAAQPLTGEPFLGDLTLELGGTADGNVAAAAASLSRASSFLASALK